MGQRPLKASHQPAQEIRVSYETVITAARHWTLITNQFSLQPHISFLIGVMWYYSPVYLYALRVVSFLHVVSNVFTSVVMKRSVFWDIKLWCPLKVNRRFGGTCACCMVVSRLEYSSTLNSETCSFETSVDFQRITRRYMPEDRTLIKQKLF
jgi:hypothetical protein